MEAHHGPFFSAWQKCQRWHRCTDMASLSCIKVEEVATRAAQMVQGSPLAKFNIEEAYRIVPVHPDDKHLLSIVWNNQLHINAALPFGLRSAPLIFTALADALQWAIQQRGVPYIAHYLDDFISIGPPNSDQCALNQQIIMATCKELGVPLAAQIGWSHHLPNIVRY